MTDAPEPPRPAVPQGTSAESLPEPKGARSFLGKLLSALVAIVVGLVAIGVAGALLVGGLVVVTCSR